MRDALHGLLLDVSPATQKQLQAAAAGPDSTVFYFLTRHFQVLMLAEREKRVDATLQQLLQVHALHRQPGTHWRGRDGRRSWTCSVGGLDGTHAAVHPASPLLRLPLFNPFSLFPPSQ